MKTIDVHAHLCDEKFDVDRTAVLQRIDDEMQACICASYDERSSLAALSLAQKHKKIFACVGVHPENAEEFSAFLPKLEEIAKAEKVVGIGEIGLDYHFFSGKNEAEIEEIKRLQKRVFVRQIQLANQLSLPIEVHCRDAMADALEILRQNPPKKPSLMHCFSGTIAEAEELMSLGFSFSFGGVTTFKNGRAVQEVVRLLPLENIMLETDCPYLCPEPFRGRRNEPVNVKYVADKIAQLKEISFEEVVERTSENAIKMFGLKI